MHHDVSHDQCHYGLGSGVVIERHRWWRTFDVVGFSRVDIQIMTNKMISDASVEDVLVGETIAALNAT